VDNYNNSWQQQGRSMAGSNAEPEHEVTAMKKHGHVAQGRSVQKSHALPRSSSRPRSRPKSRGKTRSSSRGRMDSPPGNSISDETTNNGRTMKRSGSLNRFSSWSIIRDGKIDEQGRCRRHPNIELYRREATNSNESWRMLLQDCPLCSLHDSGLNCSSDYSEMMMIRKDSTTLSGEATAQTTPSSGEETSIESDTSNNNNNDHISKREKMGQSPSTTIKQQKQPVRPPPPRKQASVHTLKALGKMHMDNADNDTASISVKSISSRRSRHPPPPPPAGRNPFSSLNPIIGSPSPSKKGSNSSISSLSTKELSRLRKERHSSESINERIAQLRGEQQQQQQNSQRKEGDTPHDLGRSLERFRAERKAAKDELKERLKSGRSRKQKERDRLEESSGSGTYTLPLNDDVRSRGRATVARNDDDILGAAAEIRSRARRSLSRSRDRKASEDNVMFGSTPSVSGDDRTVDGDAVSVSSRGRRSITNPHGLAEPPRPLPVQRRSQSRERRRSHSRGRTVDGGGSERQGYNGMNERSSEVLINRRREMRQRLTEKQTAAEYRRKGGATHVVGETDHQSVRDDVFEDRTRETRRSARSAERGERGRGRSRSRVRDGLSKIRSASLKAFRKKDQKKLDKEEQRMSPTRSLVSQGSRIRSRTLEIEEQTVDSGRMSFRSLVSHGSSRLRSRSHGRRVKSQGGEFDNENSSHLSPTFGRSGAFEE